jgi:carbonic anhydrase
LPKHAERFRELALAQSPDTLMITCSDSRVVPDLLASTDPGELFIMRNVGNLIPPATDEGISIGDLSEASAIEYAVLVLKVANIVVCGHSECGAMKAAMERNPRPDTPNLEMWLHHARTAAFRLEHEGALDATLQPHDQLSQLNVLVQLEHLMSYPIVRAQVAAGVLRLSGWWFDIAAGNMYSSLLRCHRPRVSRTIDRSSRGSLRSLFDFPFATARPYFSKPEDGSGNTGSCPVWVQSRPFP